MMLDSRAQSTPQSGLSRFSAPVRRGAKREAGAMPALPPQL